MKWIKSNGKCPICGKESLEILTDDSDVYLERCSNGCYTYDFQEDKRIK